MVLDLTPDELLTSTRTVRKRLDLDRPVDRSTVEQCLDLALQAPNGSNQQMWTWIFVDDPAKRTEVADIYRDALDSYASRPDSLASRKVELTPAQQRMRDSVYHLRDNLHRVPVLLVPVLHARLEGASPFMAVSSYGSIIPAIWSFMLALRSRGMGSAWTTITLHREAEMGAALGIPAGSTHMGVFPVAYTVGTEFKPAPRRPAADVMAWNSMEGSR
ncbi:MAG: nitroreductase family protein [Acidimicrobiales bacterium]|nr:nitroreductase family protein [Acidimicrobiales bacterium]